MRLPNSAHEAHRWVITQIAADFKLLDVWALPVQGDAEDFQTLLELMVSSDPANAESLLTRVLWRARDQLGGWFGLGRISAPVDSDDDPKLPIPDTTETTMRDRLPTGLRNTTGDLHFSSLPFAPLYRTDVEFAAELSNRTMHGVMHLAWVDQGQGRYQGQMAVYVKPRGRLGASYMVLIEPFRQLIVYPALMRQIGRAWDARTSHSLGVI